MASDEPIDLIVDPKDLLPQAILDGWLPNENKSILSLFQEFDQYPPPSHYIQPLLQWGAQVQQRHCHEIQFHRLIVRKISSLLIFAGHSFKFRFIPLQFSLFKSQLTFISLLFPSPHDLMNHSRPRKQDDIGN